MLIVLCFLFILFGLYGLAGLYWFEEKLIFQQSMAFYIFLIFISVFQIFLNLKNLKYKQYFISWDDDEIRYLVPKSKQTEIIEILSIQSIEINNGQIIIKTSNNEEKRFNSNLFFIPKRNTVVDYFKALKSNIEKNN